MSASEAAQPVGAASGPNALRLRVDHDHIVVLLPGETATLGRAVECTIQVENPYVSRAHAVVRYEEAAGLWRLEDQSSSGTYVDGVQVGSVDIGPDVTVWLGGAKRGARLDLQVEVALVSDLDEDQTLMDGADERNGAGTVVDSRRQLPPETGSPVSDWKPRSTLPGALFVGLVLALAILVLVLLA